MLDKKEASSCDTAGKEYYKCLCGASKMVEVAAVGHDWNEADCYSPKTCDICGETQGNSLGHEWVDATYDAPKTCDRCGETEGEALPTPEFLELFPDLSSFKTPQVYASPVVNRWEYQATVKGNEVYFYVIQRFNNDVAYSEVMDLSLNHVLITSEIGNFVLCSNGAFDMENEVDIVNAEYVVKVNNEGHTEYYFKVTLANELEEDLAINMYSYDSNNKVNYGYSDVTTYFNNVFYHTHMNEKLYVGDKIKFKSETLYLTDDAYQSPSPEKWGYHMQAAREGLYIYVYQNVNQVVNLEGQNWTATHVEFSIYHHSFGYGANFNRIEETYIAVWPNKSYYINDNTNVYSFDLDSTVVTNNRVEYRIFIRFNNNLDNPQDGPYAFVKVRNFDPTDNSSPYSENDVVEYRDNRFVHTIKGDSVFVYEKIKHLDNPYENDYLTSRLNTWKQMNLANSENLTLFIGDSFFENDNWWVNFYNDYQNKACFTSAIGGTKVTQWLNWIPSLVAPFAGNLENIVIHLGYNDVNSTQITPLQLEFLLEELFARLHTAYPEANIYYLSIGTSYWFEYSGNTRARSTDTLTKQFASTCSYVTFVDIDACYQEYMDETGGTLESFFKDGTHPKNENYKYIIAALEEAGCVIADK